MNKNNASNTNNKPKNKKSLKKIILLLSVIILLIFIIITVFFKILNLPPKSMESENIIQVKKGLSVSNLINELYKKNLIRSKFFFKFIARTNSLNKKLIPGYYKIKKGMTSRDILNVFSSGNIMRIRITIPEGFTNLQIAEKLESEGLCSKEDFLKLSQNPEVAKKYNINAISLEGYLFPATYNFPYKAEPETIINEMIKNFNAFTSNIGSSSNGLSFHESIILASIIEGETFIEEEKPLISGVYLNRLKKNMNLQSCVTVKFIKMPQIIEYRKKITELKNLLKREPDNVRKAQIQREIEIFTKRATIITYNDLKLQSDYNTYINKGLPPGPVCNPGLNTIKAAFKPSQTENMFYFWDAENRVHIFSKTFNEHQRKLTTMRKTSRSFASGS